LAKAKRLERFPVAGQAASLMLGVPRETMVHSIHKGYVPGCIGRITELHASFYSAHAGFGAYFERKVANELAEFCTRYAEDRDGLWLAVVDGRIEGAIAIDGLQAASEGAHLRWFITSDRTRGSGIGGQLLEAALDFCDGRHYSRVFLWTFDGLHAARHLYEKHGFKLLRQQAGQQWGTEVQEQCFVREAGR
jgi:GNAT superfamily N-acetyltransferase